MSKPIRKTLYHAIVSLIETAKAETAVYVNAKVSLLYWNIGAVINKDILQNKRATYGNEILATLSQQLTQNYGRGYSYSALTRMCKIATCFSKENIATLSQQFSYSHLIEFVAIEEKVMRDFYILVAAEGKWSLRQLREQIDKMLFERTALAKKPVKQIAEALASHIETPNPDLVFKTSYVLDFLNLPSFFSEAQLEKALLDNLQQFIMELGNGFTFVERQKRISVDAVDYHLDLLFYHRKLKRLIAIELKLGKFKPDYKGQMELYLKWLKKHDMQTGEDTPLGLLLCSEGNTEHIELLMLDEDEIKVAQYLTELPSKQWFLEKLHRSIEIAKSIKENQ
jgi:predicted nuclease of restriction endonuclease-like (RecB) superfamily